MIVVDAFFRFSGVGLLLMLAILAAVHFRNWRSAPYLILTCVSLSALLIGYAPSSLKPSGIPYIVVRLLDVPHLVLLWLFVLSIFDSDFALKPFHLGVSFFYCLPMLWVRMADFGWLTPYPKFVVAVISGLSLVLIVHLCLKTLKGRRDDLLDSRRRSRIYFVVLIAFVTVIAAISEPLIADTSNWRQTSKAMIIWPAIVFGFIWMTTFDKKRVVFVREHKGDRDLSQRDKQLIEKIIFEMEHGLAYKDADLSIGSLAKKIGVSQHRLRSLINQGLGHRNFSAFVNEFRVKDIKAAFANGENARIPILTLAFESGFKSLSSFNRIFKSAENMTPSEYRNQC